jgi:triphosphoribosyl-dephospho-CoA synthetase
LCSSPKNQFISAIATPTRADALNVVVLEGSDYQISAATFPTYFLKDLSDAAETHIRLDLDLFQRYIAPALNAEVRFVGTEPYDALTNHYNTIMKEVLPEVVEIQRLTIDVMPGSDRASAGLSASAVREALDRGSFREASAFCPETTWPYLLADLADRAMRLELDTPGKPGLVGPDSCGAHKDMDYSTMRKGMAALRPFWPRMAMANSAEELRQLGIEAEKAMMNATGGVNTHRGAIFCLGLALNAQGDSSRMAALAAQICGENRSRGARQIALDGYKPLFEDWLPYYASGAGELKTLLRIMSTLDDTCVIKRAGAERAQEVKHEAKALLEMADQVGHDASVMPGSTGHLCGRYAAEGISPGGAADMLALTIFIHSIIS